jgi:hypothetical protein
VSWHQLNGWGTNFLLLNSTKKFYFLTIFLQCNLNFDILHYSINHLALGFKRHKLVILIILTFYLSFVHRIYTSACPFLGLSGLFIRISGYPSICIYVHLSVYPSICLSIHSSAYQSTCFSIHPSVCLSIHPSICLYLHLSVYTSICLSIHSSVCLSIHLLVYPSICPSIHPFVCLSIHLFEYPSIHLPFHIWSPICPSVYFPSTCLSTYWSVHRPANPSVCPYICPSACPSICPSVYLRRTVFNNDLKECSLPASLGGVLSFAVVPTIAKLVPDQSSVVDSRSTRTSWWPSSCISSSISSHFYKTFFSPCYRSCG